MNGCEVQSRRELANDDAKRLSPLFTSRDSVRLCFMPVESKQVPAISGSGDDRQQLCYYWHRVAYILYVASTFVKHCACVLKRKYFSLPQLDYR